MPRHRRNDAIANVFLRAISRHRHVAADPERDTQFRYINNTRIYLRVRYTSYL